LAGKKILKIRIVSDTQLDGLVTDILTLINEANITFFDAFGVLKTVENELTLAYYDEGDEND